MGIAASPPSSHPCRGRQHPRVPCGATGSADGGERDGGETPPRRPPRAERPPCPAKASRRRPRHHPRYQKPAAAVPGAAGRPCAAFPGGWLGGGVWLGGPLTTTPPTAPAARFYSFRRILAPRLPQPLHTPGPPAGAGTPPDTPVPPSWSLHDPPHVPRPPPAPLVLHDI